MVIVLDLSYSMLATDIAPNRLEAAKTVFTQFLEGLNQHRVGVVLFAGKAFQSLPLNYDTKFMEEFMNDLEIETLNQNHPDMQGTAIGDALMMAASLLQREENEREKVILLATDGEANKGLEPEIALQFVKKQGYKVYTIGIGKEKESTLLLRNAL